MAGTTVFAATGNVTWVTALVLAAGNGTGTVVASRIAVRGGERPIRMVVGVALLVMAARLLWP